MEAMEINGVKLCTKNKFRWHLFILSYAAAGIWSWAITLSAADWPTFRGPRGDGHAMETNLPLRWSTTENIVWKRPIPGEGWSSPVIVDDRVYVTAAIPAGGGGSPSYSLHLLCISAQTGETIFDVEVFREDSRISPKIHTKNSHASPTPIVSGERIYVHFGHEGTACLDTRGKIVWRNRTLRYPPVHGAGGTPILVDESLIFSCDGESAPFVVALDAETGSVRWKIDRPTDATKKFSFSTPTLIHVNGQPQVVTPGSNVMLALNPATGDTIWSVRYDGYSVIPKPVFGHGLVYVCTGYNNPTLIAVKPTGRGDITDSHIAWRVTKGVPHTASLLLVEDLLFMVSDAGVASCLDAKSGESVWQKRLGGNFSASPLFANGVIYFQNEEGDTTVVRASREYEVVATSSVGERTLASLSAAMDSIFLRSNKHLYRIVAQK